MILVLALLAQAGATEWSTDFEASLAKAREREAVLCVAVVDDNPASQETLRSFDADSVRPLVSRFLKVKVPLGGKEAEFLHARWAPTVVLFQGRKDPPPTPEDQVVLKTLREKRISLDARAQATTPRTIIT